MKETRSAITKVILSSSVATVATYLARSSCLDELQNNGIIGRSVNLELLKTALLIVGVVLSLVFLSARVIKLEYENKRVTRQRDSLIKYNKKTFIKAMGECLQLTNKNIDLNIRLYFPERTFQGTIKKLLTRLVAGRDAAEEIFKVRNIEGLAEKSHSEPLKFRVRPDPQWLVGQCYTKKELVYDSDLKSHKSHRGLRKYIQARISKLQFCMCIPVLDEKDHVLAIISFDSEQKLQINEQNRAMWEEMIEYYCEDLVENLPEFFKKGGS